MSSDQSEDSVHRWMQRNCATQGELVFGQTVFLPSPRPPSPHSLCQPSTRPRPSRANPRWRPHYEVRFFQASKNHLRAGYVSLGHVINRCSCSLHNQDANESTTLTQIRESILMVTATDSFRYVQIMLVSFLFSTFNSIFSNA